MKQSVKTLLQNRALPLLLAWWLLKGRYPLAWSELALRASVLRPRGLNAKIRRRMAKDRSKQLRMCANKLAARDYISAQVGSEYLPDLLQVCVSPRDVDFGSLPESFVAKASWRSGGTIICRPFHVNLQEKRLDTHFPRLVTNKKMLSSMEFVNFFEKLNRDYFWEPGRFPEWAYQGITRKILIEELLSDTDGSLPKDFKFFCFNGKVEFVQVDFPLQPFRDIYSPDWRRIPVRVTYENSSAFLDPPANLSKMISLAQFLTRDWDFLRVDMYSVRNQIRIGELTCYPEGGTGKIRPRRFDRQWGRLWTSNGRPEFERKRAHSQ